MTRNMCTYIDIANRLSSLKYPWYCFIKPLRKLYFGRWLKKFRNEMLGDII